jgi:hypothetical protein
MLWHDICRTIMQFTHHIKHKEKQSMKNNMRLVIAMLLFGAATLQTSAQNLHVSIEPNKIQKILDKAFIPALHSDIPGIVEGSLYNIVLCKKYFSTLDYTPTFEMLKVLIAENRSSAISYKAHLTMFYLSNADNIVIEPKSDPESQDYLFKQISKELEKKLLVSNETNIQ